MAKQEIDLFDQEWLEDSKAGKFSRVAIGAEDSTWRCNNCGAGDADPHEHGCQNCGEEPDGY